MENEILKQLKTLGFSNIREAISWLNTNKIDFEKVMGEIEELKRVQINFKDLDLEIRLLEQEKEKLKQIGIDVEDISVEDIDIEKLVNEVKELTEVLKILKE